MEAATHIKRPALRYRGGKWALAPRIIAHFPPHECYVEPFMGACSVLIQKPVSDFEVVNDVDDMIVSFFQCLRDRPEELVRAVELTPISRAEYERCRAPADDPLEKARRLYVLCSQGRGSASTRSGWRYQAKWGGWRKDYPRLYKDLRHFAALAERLAYVQIEHGDAIGVIERYSRASTLLFVDPPYPPRDGKPRRLYRHELDEAGHQRLAAALRSSCAMVALSGEPGTIYDGLFSDWKRHTWEVKGEQHNDIVECLWLNPAAVAAKSVGPLFDGQE